MSAHITASIYTSHVPAIGAAMDLGKTHEPYWQKLFVGYDFSRRWIREHTPDVVFLVYNDHATSFSLEIIPTFAIGTAAEYAIADEGWGPRPVPKVIGDPAALAQVPHIDYVREAGSEGIELVMWLIARGAMSDVARGATADTAGGRKPTVTHRFYHVPASNTAVGHLILEN